MDTITLYEGKLSNEEYARNMLLKLKEDEKKNYSLITFWQNTLKGMKEKRLKMTIEEASIDWLQLAYRSINWDD